MFVVSVTDCGTPPAIANAAVSAPVTTYPSQATYTCTVGFWFSTDVFTATVSCGTDGFWSVISHNCTGTHCLLHCCGITVIVQVSKVYQCNLNVVAFKTRT